MRLIYRDKAMAAHPDKSAQATPSQQAAIRQLNVARELLEKWYKSKGEDLDAFNESALKHDLEKQKGSGKGKAAGKGKGKPSNLDGRGAKESTGQKAKGGGKPAATKPAASVKKAGFDKTITTEAIVPTGSRKSRGRGKGKGVTPSSALVPAGTTLATM